jgi:putative ABC transport system substrate-binding protein
VSKHIFEEIEFLCVALSGTNMKRANRMTGKAIQRREFLTLLGGAAAAWPLAARAQQRVPRVAALLGFVESDPEAQRNLAALRQSLQQLGWVAGQTIQIEYRWVGADVAFIRSQAADLVRQKPEVILATSGLVVALLLQETRTIPIVFVQVNDPVESGLVTNLARPGGNLTGFTPFEFSATAKWLEMLKEMAPSVLRVGVIMHPDQVTNVGTLHTLEAAAASLGLRLTALGVRDSGAIEREVGTFALGPNGGLVVVPNSITISDRALIIALAARHRLPAAYPYSFYVREGGLISYGTKLPELYRQAATYIDRILKGERPGDLPIQQPTKFEFLVNLSTAKMLGLDVPTSILLRADEVIE